MRRVVLESPFAGRGGSDFEREQDHAANIAYARRALLDCLKREEAPLASHILYPVVLNDVVPEDRALGMKAGHAWIQQAHAMVIYADRGITPGMEAGITIAKAWLVPVETRYLDKEGT